ncbi:MAG: SBBP repeat-containing protein [Blastocatellia bacterium]
MKRINRSLSICVAFLIAAGIVWIHFQDNSSAFVNEAPAKEAKEAARNDRADSVARKRIRQAYTQLPLRFEANVGQASEPAKFVARGVGYALLLTPQEAVLQMRQSGQPNRDEARQESPITTLRMKPVAANRAPRISALEPQTGRSNYFTGRERLSDVEGFGRVKYDNVWKGVDLIFYGNQQQLEYDFRLAPGADPKRIRLAFNGAEMLAVDEQGALVVQVGGREVRWSKPVAFQQVNGARREIACDYRIKNGNQIEFQLGQYDAAMPLVIDPALVYSTLLGGLFDDFAYGLAVDAAGNAFIAGSTNSTDFTTVNPAQPALGSRNRTDAFVLKIAPNGSNLIYSTYLGGSGGDAAYAIAIDESGNATIAGETDSTDFPKPVGGIQPTLGGGADAFVARLNAAGSQLISSTLIGGNYGDRANGLALDSAGNAYITGQTDSTNFPTLGSARTNNTTPFFKTTDAAANWSASGNGLPNAPLLTIGFSPANTIFAATTQGLFKSTDGGGQWNFTGLLPSVSGTQPVVNAIVFDPKMPTIAYLATSLGVYKSFNGGTSFQLRSIGLPSGNVFALLVDPVNPATLYAGTPSGVYKSVNGGESWIPANSVSNDSLSSTTIRNLVFDPTNPATIYAGTSRGVYKTVNSAGVWAAVNSGLGTGSAVPNITALAIDPTAPMTLYAGANTANTMLFKTTNGGAAWQPSDTGLGATVGGVVMRMAPVSLAVDKSMPATIYAGTPLGVFKTTNAGGNWNLASNGLAARNVTALAIDPAATNTVYAGAAAGSDAFVVKLSANGLSLLYSIFIGGDQFDVGRAVVVDRTGAAWVTGQTSSPNFSVVNGLQARINGLSDAFVAKVNAEGNALTFSTFLGGGASEVGNSIALDTAGNVYVAGATSSNNFPTANAFKATYGGGANDGFVTKYKADATAVESSTYLGGQSDDQIFALTVDKSGSVWVTGSTNSSDFPVVNPLRQFDFDDAFVARFNAAGKQLLFSTSLGGRFGSESGRAIAVDSMSNVYVAGLTNAPDFPLVNSVPASNATPNGFAVKIGPAADLAVTMTAAPEPVLAGQPLTYTITVANIGDLPVTGVKLNDPLPRGATLVSATTTQGSCSGISEVICNLGNLADGATARVTIIVNAPMADTTSNTVNVSANEAESKTDNNSATVASQVQTADLELTNNVSHLQIGPGGKLSWVVTIRNLSRIMIGSLTITDVLPPETTLVSCTPTAGTCGGTGTNRTVTVPSLNSGATATVILTAVVNNNVALGTSITNTASFASVTFDPNPRNNQASTTTVIVPAAAEAKNGLIAYSYTGVHFVRPDGSGKFTFLSGSGPSWSADGTKLAYELFSTRNIRVVNADGSGDRLLTNSGSSPTWSPDGTRIAFRRYPGGVFIVNADGTNEKMILGESTLLGDDIKWSPDGTKLLISDYSISVFNLDGSGFKDLVSYTSSNRNEYGNWSPDGTKIIFARSDQNSALYTINPDGSGLARLGNVSGRYPTYSPDGTKLAYAASNGQLMVANADGTSPVRIVNESNNNVISSISWQRTTATQPKNLVVSGFVGISSPTMIELSGARTGSTSTNFDGIYAIGNLKEGESLTITPVSNFYRFDPPSRTYSNLTSDQPAADFKAIRITTTIRGRITDFSGAPIGGVSVSVGSGTRTETDENGDFMFVGLSGSTSYTVTPSSVQIGDRFEPMSITFPASESDKVANFKGTREKFTIAGQVVDGAGTPVNLAIVTVSGGGSSFFMGTDSQGRFSAANVPGGYVYSVTAQKSGITILPAQRRALLSRNLDLRFIAGINPLAAASAASYNPQGVTVGGIVALFGEGLATTTRAAAAGSSLPFELDGVSVFFSNRNTAPQRCQLFFVSPNQVNAVIPTPGFSSDVTSMTGEALIEVRQGTRVVAAGSVRIERVAPAIVTADSSGSGLAAGVALRVKANGTQVFEFIFRFDPQSGRFVAVPIDLSNPAEQVYLVLFGTGIRYSADSPGVRVKIGGEDAMVSFSGPQPSLFAVDQVNALIPRSLAGKGEVEVMLTADGKAANPVKITIK